MSVEVGGGENASVTSWAAVPANVVEGWLWKQVKKIMVVE